MSSYEDLEALWAEPDGALYRLRQGEISPTAVDAVFEVLRRIDTDPTEASLPRRLVELTWFLPLFVSWQVERVARRGGSPELIARLGDQCCNEVERILGLP